MPFEDKKLSLKLSLNYPRGEGNWAARQGQKLSRGNLYPAATRCLTGPSGNCFYFSSPNDSENRPQLLTSISGPTTAPNHSLLRSENYPQLLLFLKAPKPPPPNLPKLLTSQVRMPPPTAHFSDPTTGSLRKRPPTPPPPAAPDSSPKDPAVLKILSVVIATCKLF